MEEEVHIKCEQVWLRECEFVPEDETNEDHPMPDVWVKQEVLVKQEASDLGAEIKRKVTSYLEKDLTSSDPYKGVEGGVEEGKEEMRKLQDVKSVVLLNDAVQEQELSTSRAQVPLETTKIKSCLGQNVLFDNNYAISKNPSKVKNHLFNCQICDKAFATAGRLQHHVIVHSDNNFQCDICLKEYVYKVSLNRHMRLAHQGKPEKIRCFCCTRKFTTYDGFRKHLLVHTGERNFKCSVCKNSFANFYTLSTHLLEHMKDT
ncbi:fez family zinc finger protein 1 [Anabrus simplex]|uniref:fez family zinc finger protein 1 n=1 Tax=Anabrus simplex TaxID=316456 RepID=UPI0035A2C959